MTKYGLKPAAMLLVCIWLSTGSVATAADQIADVRVLIDISGSMKKSDPQNLRVPATRLIAGLMPEGSRCGVWTFGRYVNMLVPVRPVNDAWRELAKEKSVLINSTGLYTNIEGVLENASSGWFDVDPATKRSLILLSDGYVDVSKNAAESAASRQRIIEETLPRLKKAGVEVHTVALSDDADHKLLETISIATGGSYLRASEASTLNRLFLKLFEKSVEAPSLPLNDNKFKVDKSIKNMTLVIMQGANAKPAALIQPDGKLISQVSHPETVKWHHENGFDLVTVEAPAEGDWQIDASTDPDNRVIVATNIELAVSPLPNVILPSEVVHVSGHMLEDGKPLVKRELLNSIDMVMLQEQHDGTAQSIKLNDDGIPPDLSVGDGVYSTTMKPLDVQGIYELSLIAASPTFEREYRHTIQVMGEPINTDVTELGEDKGGVFLLKLTPRLDKSIMSIDSLTLKLAGSAQPAVELPRNDTDDTWNFELPQRVAGKYLTFAATGKMDGERDFHYEWDVAMPGAPVLPEIITEIAKQPELVPEPEFAANETATDEVSGQVPAAEPAEDLVEHPAEPAPEEKENKGTNWALVIGIIGGVNLLFATVGGVWWWLARKRKRAGENDDELEIDAVAKPAQSKSDNTAATNSEAKAKESSGKTKMNQDAVTEEIKKAEEAEKMIGDNDAEASVAESDKVA